MKHFDPETQIAITWSVPDVQAIRPDLNDKQAKAVLDAVKEKHDADIGINWDVIESRAYQMFPPLP